jgi:hypothetical protein
VASPKSVKPADDRASNRLQKSAHTAKRRRFSATTSLRFAQALRFDPTLISLGRAATCATRWHAAKREVLIVKPTDGRMISTIPFGGRHERAGSVATVPRLRPSASATSGADRLRQDLDGRAHHPARSRQGQPHHLHRERGFSSGWAAHKYRERFGVWPNDARVKHAAPRPPSLKTKNWIRSRQIAFAKGRRSYG